MENTDPEVGESKLLSLGIPACWGVQSLAPNQQRETSSVLSAWIQLAQGQRVNNIFQKILVPAAANSGPALCTVQSCTQQQDRDRERVLSLQHRRPGKSCASGSSLALGRSICGLCGHPEGPQCPQPAPKAAGCQLLCVLLLQTIPSCWIHSSLFPAPLSGLLSDIVFEFPGNESPAATAMDTRLVATTHVNTSPGV